jgi:predicted nucleotidyltransferase
MDREAARPSPRQPELQPRPSHDATDCGAVAAATCTGGVGLRPPRHGTPQPLEGGLVGSTSDRWGRRGPGYNRARYAYIGTRRAGSDRSQGAARMNAVAAEAMIERAGRALIDAAPAPAKVILFGSHARGDADDGSDFDFLVIEETVPDRLAEAVRLRDALGDFNAPVDVIVMDAALAERRARVRGTMVHRALREGRVLAES